MATVDIKHAFVCICFINILVVRTTGKCGGRTVFTNLTGVVSDGIGKYPENTLCEWLIQGPAPNMSITLSFTSYDTECSFDFLFIHDGPSYSSPLLASFSGNTLPQTVVAHSGMMLINLYSDTNYVRDGFKGNYTIEHCEHNCSGHGTCVNGHCQCERYWRGTACDLKWCPNFCHYSEHKGECDFNLGHCVCKDGFTGESCSFSSLTDSQANSWFNLVQYSTVFTPRTGHAGVHVEETDTLWVFGGYSLNTVYQDLLKFNFTTSQWKEVDTVGKKPLGRHSHTLCQYHDGLLLFGGELAGEALANDLWLFNTTSGNWSLLAVNDSSAPPPTASHTANVVDEKMIVYGGRTDVEHYSSSMYTYSMTGNTGWREVKYRGGKKLQHRVLGHTTVHHPGTRSLIVFGGFFPDNARRSMRTETMQVFHLDELVWTEWKPTGGKTPSARAFHSAVLAGDYLLIYGGNVHFHSTDETCYENELYFYHLKCHKWISHSVFSSLSPPASESSSPRGRFSHVSVLRGGTALLILGGYRGVTLGDMHAYKLPKAVASASMSDNATIGDHCSEYRLESSCKADPACGWCSPAQGGSCMAVQDSNWCASGLKTDACQGLCGVFTQCSPCLLWNATHAPCGWCVQDSRCYPRDSPGGSCNASQWGWWGSSSKFLRQRNQCVSENFPPGLTVVSYKSPSDDKQPDGVSLITNAQDSFTRRSSGQVASKHYLGYVHPFIQEPSPKDPYKVKLKVASKISSAVLALSTDDTVDKAENVVSCVDTVCDEYASRTSGQPLFPSPSNSQKYFMKMEINKDANDVQTLISVQWNQTSSIYTTIAITGQFLQPFSGSNCAVYSNCLACMTDASCGWCDLSHSCIMRKAPAVCESGGHSEMVILNATQCVVCDDYVDCLSCTQDVNCGWSNASVECKRRGLLSNAAYIKEPELCKSSCTRRQTCSSCVSDGMGCGWCEKTSSCFLFAAYITQYAYGQCSHWIDRNSKGECVACSEHTEFRSCLAEIKCGWCGDDEDPRNGSCHKGGFLRPDGGDCSALYPRNGSVSWSYARIPDVNECKLGIASCGDNATCINSPESYECVCNRGYEGNGENCTKTCYHDCGEHGECDMTDYKCRCHLGWMGLNCTIDCACHGHSWCPNGIGVCDKCQDYSHGHHCELCVHGSYGNATTAKGCSACACNEHGDESLGQCDGQTGQCFCVDDTQGDHCDQCLPGLVGDPRGGDGCYYECEGQSVLTNITQGDISSPFGSGVSEKAQTNCRWVISSYVNSIHNVVYSSSQPTKSLASVTLTFKKISLDCFTDHVDVYDGLPPFVLGAPPRDPPTFYKLGSFCGAVPPRPVTAKLGNMVIVFKGTITALSSKFSARFTVTSCPDSCPINGKCVLTSHGLECQCRQGWSGVQCDSFVCPMNCSFVQGRGACNLAKGRCDCVKGFTGVSCSDVVTPGKGLWELVSDLPSLNISASPLARLGHVVVNSNDSLFVYGGYSLVRGRLSDIWRFDVNSSAWQLQRPHQVEAEMPLARYFHCGVLYQDTLVVHGGMTTGGIDSTVWHYNISTLTWSKFNQGPTLAGHTSVLIGDVMIVIGGYSPDLGFSEKTHEYHVINKQWSVLSRTGSPPTGLFAHTAVYHADTRTVLVFGGYRFKVQWVMPSEDLYSLHVPSNTWSILQARPFNQPSPKFFHVAAMIGDVMMVYGGRSNTTDQFFSSELLAYHIRCNYWHTISVDDMKGESPGALLGAAVGVVGSVVYMFGGFSGEVRSELYRVTLPTDYCHAITLRDSCVSTPGCSWCQVYSMSGNISHPTNQSVCYPVGQQVPDVVCHAQANVTQVQVVNGTRCDVSEVSSRECGTYYSCSTCLARYPGATGNPAKCQWCFYCMSGGKCVTAGANCDEVHPCEKSPKQIVFSHSQLCIENRCEATTCAGCANISNQDCVWTPHLHWTSETNRTYKTNGLHPWSCFMESTVNKTSNLTILSPPQACPTSCTRHTDCKACLNSQGGDGGWTECVWSESLRTCFSPSFLPLVCAAGACGRIIRHSSQDCPSSCTQSLVCSACLDNASCGWCSKQGTRGDGICMEGSFQGPLFGTCEGNTIDPGPVSVSNVTAMNTTRDPVWATVLCPLENECTSGKHNCSLEVEICVDKVEGFKCNCRSGYAADGMDGECVPTCEQGCVHGQCVAPDVCECSFGWTSHNCTVACKCHHHGQCANTTHLDECHDCRNNTVGRSCEWCAPLFVGDSRNNGTCKTCHEVCNRSADVCMEKVTLNETRSNNRSLKPSDVQQWLKHGPREISREDGECHCLKLSRGVKCMECLPGYFFLDDYCSRCLCNGHADRCDTRGTCACTNNTVENCQEHEQCYRHQCASCRESFMGAPTDNRQCYKKITVMQEFIIGATYSDNPALLPPQQAIFFALYPRFTNVDMRMTIDIFQGEVDVYVSSSNRAFNVSANKRTGAHVVTIEKPAQVLERNGAQDRLNTFVSYSQDVYALVVKAVNKRLVVTFPHAHHELRDTRFYLLFHTRSTHAGSRGVLYFRQDLSQIDLFVFFSVFFSVFFLTMSCCVLVWKLKIYLNQRRVHHVESVELENRRSRPFATYAFLYGNKDPPRSCWKRSARAQQLRPMNMKERPVISPMAQAPVGDGRAAVITVMFQMPGNECSEFQLAVGSALTFVSGQQTMGTQAGVQTQTGHKIRSRRTCTITQ